VQDTGSVSNAVNYRAQDALRHGVDGERLNEALVVSYALTLDQTPVIDWESVIASLGFYHTLQVCYLVDVGHYSIRDVARLAADKVDVALALSLVNRQESS
jgi:hypothetical protein